MASDRYERLESVLTEMYGQVQTNLIQRSVLASMPVADRYARRNRDQKLAALVAEGDHLVATMGAVEEAIGSIGPGNNAVASVLLTAIEGGVDDLDWDGVKKYVKALPNSGLALERLAAIQNPAPRFYPSPDERATNTRLHEDSLAAADDPNRGEYTDRAVGWYADIEQGNYEATEEAVLSNEREVEDYLKGGIAQEWLRADPGEERFRRLRGGR